MRPAWLRSKGERNAADDNRLESYRDAILCEYETAVSDMFVWELPEELSSVPPHWPEQCLFRTGTLGISPAPLGGYALVPGHRIRRTIYGTAITWQPGLLQGSDPPLGWRVLNNEEWPLLELPDVPESAAYPYAELESSAMVSCGQNTIAMRQPVAVRGQAGTVGLSYVRDALGKGDSYLPLISDGDGIARELEVVDLKASNWLDPLTGFADWADGAGCAALGLDAPSTNKASGITTQEATALNNRIRARRERMKEIRQEWCIKVEKATGLHISVKISEEYANDPLAVVYGAAVGSPMDGDTGGDTPQNEKESDQNGN